MAALMSAAVRLRHFFFPERGIVLLPPYAVVAAVAIAFGVGIALTSPVQRVEWSLYDRMLSVATREPRPSPDVVIVAIDEPSFSQIGLAWPWPRRVHAALVDALIQGGARTIVFDIVFDEPTAKDDDEAIAAAIRRAGNVVLASDRAVTTDRAYDITQWVDPIPELADAASAVGAVSVSPDPDGVIRRVATTADGRPMVASAAAARFSGSSIAEERERLIPFLGAPRRGIVTYSYYQALEPGLLPRDAFRGKAVFIGRALSAAAALDQPDHFRTPVGVFTPGVEIHANQFDMLVRHRTIADPFGTARGAGGWAMFAGAVAAVVFFTLTPHVGLIVALISGAAGLSTAYAALAVGDVRLPVAGPFVAVLSVYAATSAYRFALGQRERRLIRRAFQHYLAPALVQQILDDPSRLKLGGETFEVTVLFTDLEGFTSFAERMSPDALRMHLSQYFQAMMDVLLAERATLDKFIGDAIMVYFGCPVRDPAHPAQACRAALAMQRRLDVLNEEWRLAGVPPLRMRVGVNTGSAVAGNMGTDQIFNYTIIGDCVNLASRLEGVNKTYGTRVIVGADTWARVSHEFEARQLDVIRVKGKVAPVSIYELLSERGRLDERMQGVRERYSQGLTLYRAGRWHDASIAFHAALDIDPSDQPSRMFVERCAEYATTPPLDGWDGVYSMLTK